MKNLAEVYSECASPDIGEEVHVNHRECGDTRARLYIKRSTENVVLAYCHNCGERGRYFDASVQGYYVHSRKKLLRGSVGETKRSLHLPRDYTQDFDKFPVRARLWLHRAGFGANEIAHTRIGFSEWYKRLVLPVFDTEGVALYQLRRVEPEDEGPKYTTYKTPRFSGFLHNPTGSKTVCVVEDYLSSLRVGEFVAGFSLLGTHLSDSGLARLLEFDKALIFLDNDNAQVKIKQTSLYKRLSLLKEVSVIRQDKDPKEFDNSTLRGILCP